LASDDYSGGGLAERQIPHDDLSTLTAIKQQNFDFRWRKNEAALTTVTHVKTVTSAVCNMPLLAEREEFASKTKRLPCLSAT
jgi:hypothetical protein